MDKASSLESDHGHVEGMDEVSDVDLVPLALRDNLHPKDVRR